MSPIAALMMCAVCAQAAVAAEPAWTRIDDADGVETYRADMGAGNLAFRGRAVVPAALTRTAAVLMEESTAQAWVYHCAEARVLARVAPLHLVTYRRNTAGVPLVADRDMVLDLVLTPDLPRHRLTLDFSRHPDDGAWPVPRGVVRVPRIEGFFRCDAIDAAHTQVVYQVSVDTGGSLPAFLVARATAELPRRTLAGLRDEVAKPIYDAPTQALAAALAAAGGAAPQGTGAPPPKP